jgi:hypothetical protein
MAETNKLPKGATPSNIDAVVDQIPTDLPADIGTLPKGASKIELPSGASLVKAPTTSERFAEIPTQFVAGMNDVTAFLAKPFEQVFGTISIGAEGVEYLTPEETEERRAEGRLGLPGMATRKPTSLVGRAVRMGGQTAAFGPVFGRAATKKSNG